MYELVYYYGDSDDRFWSMARKILRNFQLNGEQIKSLSGLVQTCLANNRALFKRELSRGTALREGCEVSNIEAPDEWKTILGTHRRQRPTRRRRNRSGTCAGLLCNTSTGWWLASMRLVTNCTPGWRISWKLCPLRQPGNRTTLAPTLTTSWTPTAGTTKTINKQNWEPPENFPVSSGLCSPVNYRLRRCPTESTISFWICFAVGGIRQLHFFSGRSTVGSLLKNLFWPFVLLL